MRRILFITLFAIVLLLCMSRAARAAETGGSSAFERDLAIARAAMAAGDAATALPIYDRLVAENPVDTELRLEAARAHYAAGNEREALRLGREVLRDYESRRFQFHGTVWAGVLYDSNANQGPGSDSFRLGNWDVNIYNSKGKSSGGAQVGFNLDAGWRLSAISPWWLVGDASGFMRVNFNGELEDVNKSRWQRGRVAGGLRYLDGRTTFEMRLKAEVMDYEFESNVFGFGAEMRYSRAVAPRLHLMADAGFERREYSPGGERDGNFFRAGGYARFFLSELGHEFLIGGGYMEASAKNRNYGYDGWQALARFSFKLPHRITLSPQISFTQEYYNGPGTALETARRRDDRLRVGTDISYAVNNAWSIEASYYYTNTDSTSNLFKYDQHMISLGATWRF